MWRIYTVLTIVRSHRLSNKLNRKWRQFLKCANSGSIRSVRKRPRVWWQFQPLVLVDHSEVSNSRAGISRVGIVLFCTVASAPVFKCVSVLFFKLTLNFASSSPCLGERVMARLRGSRSHTASSQERAPGPARSFLQCFALPHTDC